ncbi:MAG: L-threonylcarbamoyladenylate synthase [Archaeoglobaceae archaeon]
METLVITMNPEEPEDDKIAIAADIIKKGGLVAFATETVYGLGADALNQEAVRKLFEVKQRPSENPLIIHVARKEQIYEVVEVNETAEKLIEEFFPGPIALIMNKKDIVPDEVSAGLEKVAVRMPDNKVALKLIQMSSPLAAPSANITGRSSPNTTEHVLEDLEGKIEAVIDSGETKMGIESTVVDTTVEPVEILRPGPITPEMIEKVVGETVLGEAVSGEYTHYSPRTELMVVTGNPDKVKDKISQLVVEYHDKGQKVGIIAVEEPETGADYFTAVDDDESFAKKLFSTIRDYDKKEVDVIIVEGVEERGMGYAIMNRLRKAAGRVFVV